LFFKATVSLDLQLKNLFTKILNFYENIEQIYIRYQLCILMFLILYYIICFLHYMFLEQWNQTLKIFCLETIISLKKHEFMMFYMRDKRPLSFREARGKNVFKDALPVSRRRSTTAFFSSLLYICLLFSKWDKREKMSWKAAQAVYARCSVVNSSSQPIFTEKNY